MFDVINDRKTRLEYHLTRLKFERTLIQESRNKRVIIARLARIKQEPTLISGLTRRQRLFVLKYLVPKKEKALSMDSHHPNQPDMSPTIKSSLKTFFVEREAEWKAGQVLSSDEADNMLKDRLRLVKDVFKDMRL